MIKTVLLDMDMTILDFNRSEAESLTEALVELGIEPKPETIKLYSKINLSQWKRLELGEITREQVLLGRYEMLFEQIGVEASANDAWQIYENKLSHNAHYLPGAEEMLKEFQGKYKLYIVSNGTKSVQDGRIEKSGLAKYFDDIFISQDIGFNKPDKRFFDECFKRAGIVNFEEVIIIGDSLSSDIKGGKNAGIKTCWFNPSNEVNTSSVKPDYEIDNLEKIDKLLKMI